MSARICFESICNKTKEEQTNSLDVLIYYLDENLNTEFSDEFDELSQVQVGEE